MPKLEERVNDTGAEGHRTYGRGGLQQIKHPGVHLDPQDPLEDEVERSG